MAAPTATAPLSPFVRVKAVTPNDSTDLTPAPTRALYIGTAGDGKVTVLLADDSTAVQFVGIAAGTLLHLRVKRVLNTGTGASNILALY